ncbi:hypothetical protein DITRI_Ditri01bG0075300 [Diplodiscus trichospermus]
MCIGARGEAKWRRSMPLTLAWVKADFNFVMTDSRVKADFNFVMTDSRVDFGSDSSDQQEKSKALGHSENRTRDLSHPKRESYH